MYEKRRRRIKTRRGRTGDGEARGCVLDLGPAEVQQRFLGLRLRVWISSVRSVATELIYRFEAQDYLRL